MRDLIKFPDIKSMQDNRQIQTISYVFLSGCNIDNLKNIDTKLFTEISELDTEIYVNVEFDENNDRIIYGDYTGYVAVEDELMSIISIDNSNPLYNKFIVSRGVFNTIASTHPIRSEIRDCQLIRSVNSWNYTDRSESSQDSIFSPCLSTGLIRIKDSISRFDILSTTKEYNIVKNKYVYIFSGTETELLCNFIGYIDDSYSQSDFEYIITLYDKFGIIWNEPIDLNKVFKNANIKEVLSYVLNIDSEKIVFANNTISENYFNIDYMSTNEFETYNGFLENLCKSLFVRIAFDKNILRVFSDVLIHKDFNTIISNVKNIYSYNLLNIESASNNNRIIINKVKCDYKERGTLYDRKDFLNKYNLLQYVKFNNVMEVADSNIALLENINNNFKVNKLYVDGDNNNYNAIGTILDKDYILLKEKDVPILEAEEFYCGAVGISKSNSSYINTDVYSAETELNKILDNDNIPDVTLSYNDIQEYVISITNLEEAKLPLKIDKINAEGFYSYMSNELLKLYNSAIIYGEGNSAIIDIQDKMDNIIDFIGIEEVPDGSDNGFFENVINDYNNIFTKINDIKTLYENIIGGSSACKDIVDALGNFEYWKNLFHTNFSTLETLCSDISAYLNVSTFYTKNLNISEILSCIQEISVVRDDLSSSSKDDSNWYGRNLSNQNDYIEKLYTLNGKVGVISTHFSMMSFVLNKMFDNVKIAKSNIDKALVYLKDIFYKNLKNELDTFPNTIDLLAGYDEDRSVNPFGKYDHLRGKGFDQKKNFDIYYGQEELSTVFALTIDEEDKNLNIPILPQETIEYTCTFGVPTTENKEFSKIIEDIDNIYLGDLIPETSTYEEYFTNKTLLYNKRYAQNHTCVPIYLQTNKISPYMCVTDVESSYIKYSSFDNSDIQLSIKKATNNEDDFNLYIKNIMQDSNTFFTSSDDSIIKFFGKTIQVDYNMYIDSEVGDVITLDYTIDEIRSLDDSSGNLYYIYSNLKNVKWQIKNKFKEGSSNYLVLTSTYPKPILLNDVEHKFKFKKYPYSSIIMLNSFYIKGNPVLETINNVEESNAQSIKKFGKKEYVIDGKFLAIQDLSLAIDYLLEGYNGLSSESQKKYIEFELACNYDLQLLDIIAIEDNFVLNLERTKYFIIIEKTCENVATTSHKFKAITLNEYETKYPEIPLQTKITYLPKNTPYYNHLGNAGLSTEESSIQSNLILSKQSNKIGLVTAILIPPDEFSGKVYSSLLSNSKDVELKIQKNSILKSQLIMKSEKYIAQLNSIFYKDRYCLAKINEEFILIKGTLIPKDSNRNLLNSDDFPEGNYLVLSIVQRAIFEELVNDINEDSLIEFYKILQISDGNGISITDCTIGDVNNRNYFKFSTYDGLEVYTNKGYIGSENTYFDITNKILKIDARDKIPNDNMFQLGTKDTGQYIGYSKSGIDIYASINIGGTKGQINFIDSNLILDDIYSIGGTDSNLTSSGIVLINKSKTTYNTTTGSQVSQKISSSIFSIINSDSDDESNGISGTSFYINNPKTTTGIMLSITSENFAMLKAYSYQIDSYAPIQYFPTLLYPMIENTKEKLSDVNLSGLISYHLKDKIDDSEEDEFHFYGKIGTKWYQLDNGNTTDDEEQDTEREITVITDITYNEQTKELFKITQSLIFKNGLLWKIDNEEI